VDYWVIYSAVIGAVIGAAIAVYRTWRGNRGHKPASLALEDQYQHVLASIRRPYRALLDTDPTGAGRYKLLVRLGSGGFGTVYLGVGQNKDLAAIKFLSERLAESPRLRDGFSREIGFGLHARDRYTPRILTADLAASRPWVAMEFINAPSLADIVSTRGPLSSEGVVLFATTTIRAVMNIHAAGVIHLDLNPSNILLTRDPLGIRIVDFGISQAVSRAVFDRSAAQSAAGYLSPEQAEGKKPTVASDVFTWACTVCYAASGKSPFGTGTPDQLMYRAAREDPNLPDLPAVLTPLVEASLSKDQSRRPTPQAIADALTPKSAGIAERFSLSADRLSELEARLRDYREGDSDPDPPAEQWKPDGPLT